MQAGVVVAAISITLRPQECGEKWKQKECPPRSLSPRPDDLSDAGGNCPCSQFSPSLLTVTAQQSADSAGRAGQAGVRLLLEEKEAFVWRRDSCSAVVTSQRAGGWRVHGVLCRRARLPSGH